MIKRVLVGVLRGSSFISGCSTRRTSYRARNPHECRNFNYGFRLIIMRAK